VRVTREDSAVDGTGFARVRGQARSHRYGVSRDPDEVL